MGATPIDRLNADGSETKPLCMCRCLSRSVRHSITPPPISCSGSGETPFAAATFCTCGLECGVYVWDWLHKVEFLGK